MSEEALHRSIVQYLRTVLPHGFIVMHVPNGGSRHPVEAAKLKSLGVVAGWPDISIYGPQLIPLDGPCVYLDAPSAWFLEVKTKTGRTSQTQHMMHDRLKDIGFPVAVVRSIDDVRDCIRDWNLPSKEVAA
jgi:hypothetical protein